MTIPAISELDLPDDVLLQRILTAITAHPEVREPLMRALLTEEFLNLPTEVKELREEMREGFRAVNERIDETNRSLGERIDETNRSIGEVNRSLSERIDETNRSIGEVNRSLSERIDETNRSLGERIDNNSRAISVLTGQMGELRGESYERRCSERIGEVLIDYFDRAVLSDRIPIIRQLREARRNGTITRREYESGRNVDIIAQEEADGDSPERLAIIEATITFNRGDLQNASERAELIERLTGIPTTAFTVTRENWPEAINDDAAELGVNIVQFN